MARKLTLSLPTKPHIFVKQVIKKDPDPILPFDRPFSKQVYKLDNIYTNNKGHSLFIGDKYQTENVMFLSFNNISHVFNVAGEEVNPDWQHDLNISIKYTHYPMIDNPCFALTNEFILTILQMIDQSLQYGNVLVNCYMGQSRSATICIAYLMWRNNIPYDVAFKHMRQIHPKTSPNFGFLCFLEKMKLE